MTWYNDYLRRPLRDEATARAEAHLPRFERDYQACICHAKEEAYCAALGQQDCRCLAPMIIVTEPRKWP